ncbi:MAG: rhodanese-like domain-containing protein [Anaerolineae bacterium]|nr:rhodanese-like domain-containing protein [Anaerolineae bacterium]
MRKASKKNNQRQNQRLLIGGVVFIAIIVVIGVVVLTRTSSSVSAAAKLTPAQYQQQFGSTATQHLLLDVRTPDEFASEHIAGAVNISVQTLPDRLSEVPRDIPVVIYCHSGNRSAQAARILSDAGYTNIYDLGGINAWTAAGLPTVQ